MLELDANQILSFAALLISGSVALVTITVMRKGRGHGGATEDRDGYYLIDLYNQIANLRVDLERARQEKNEAELSEELEKFQRMNLEDALAECESKVAELKARYK
jgi:hypothetical protein|tara:strand:- start:21 stop:335 length:315 start_codon:yes stop_codon:yes gene_type:complete